MAQVVPVPMSVAVSVPVAVPVAVPVSVAAVAVVVGNVGVHVVVDGYALGKREILIKWSILNAQIPVVHSHN